MIPFNFSFVSENHELYLKQALSSRHLSGDGPFTNKCSQWLQSYSGNSRVFLTHSCTAALEMTAILGQIQPGDEIIMPSYTFVSTANAFVLRGAVPVFVDIRSDTLNINEMLIEEAITNKSYRFAIAMIVSISHEIPA